MVQFRQIPKWNRVSCSLSIVGVPFVILWRCTSYNHLTLFSPGVLYFLQCEGADEPCGLQETPHHPGPWSQLQPPERGVPGGPYQPTQPSHHHSSPRDLHSPTEVTLANCSAVTTHPYTVIWLNLALSQTSMAKWTLTLFPSPLQLCGEYTHPAQAPAAQHCDVSLVCNSPFR